jgi:hypothetical protein
VDGGPRIGPEPLRRRYCRLTRLLRLLSD